MVNKFQKKKRKEKRNKLQQQQQQKRVLCNQESNTHFKAENLAENHMP